MKFSFAFYLLFSSFFVTVNCLAALPIPDSCDIPTDEINSIFNEFLGKAEKLQTRIKDHQIRVSETWKLCHSTTKSFCNKKITDHEKSVLINIIAQIDDPQVRKEIYLHLVPTATGDSAHFRNLMEYLEVVSKKCSPPRYDICDSDRFKLLFGEYFERVENSIPSLARRADVASFYNNIPGLKAAIAEARDNPLAIANNARYVDDIARKYPQGTTSIILNQARKKTLNDVSKGFSDLVGAKGNEFYFQRLNEALRKAGLPEIGDGVYIDYKEAALILDNSKIGDPAAFREIAQQAARDADRDLRNYVENNFPETLYLMDDFDRNASWINTSIFPGEADFSAQTTEALNAYRAREMRVKPASKLSPIDVIRSFVGRGQNAINFMDALASNAELVGKGVIKPNGNFNITSATIMRSLSAVSMDGKVKELRAALAAAFGKELNLKNISNAELVTMIKLYDDMDALALPLRNSDAMGQFDETIGVLGGDGIKAGAHDLIEKGDALFAHASNIFASGISDTARVKAVQAALKEGDENATKIIRSAPEIAREAISNLPDTIKARIGYKEVLASGDDSIVVATALNDLAANPKEFNSVMLQIADNLSSAKRELTMSSNGTTSTRTIGSEVLRFFGGPNKKLAEEAEKAMKPIENFLAKADFLGPTWREDYPQVGMAIWKNSDGSHEVFINGESVNPQFLEALEKVKGHLRREDRITIHVK